MENMMQVPTPDEAAAALTDAEASRSRLAGGLALPSYFYASIGVTIAVQIATTSTGLATSNGWARLGLIAGGVAPFLVVAGVQLTRFRRLNGVRVGGVSSRLVGGTDATTSTVYGLAAGAAIWAAIAGQWWSVPIAAIAGGSGYVLCGRRWMRRYRSDPATHGRGDSAAWLALIVVLAGTGMALLVAGS